MSSHSSFVDVFLERLRQTLFLSLYGLWVCQVESVVYRVSVGVGSKETLSV